MHRPPPVPSPLFLLPVVANVEVVKHDVTVQTKEAELGNAERPEHALGPRAGDDLVETLHAGDAGEPQLEGAGRQGPKHKTLGGVCVCGVGGEV